MAKVEEGVQVVLLEKTYVLVFALRGFLYDGPPFCAWIMKACAVYLYRTFTKRNDQPKRIDQFDQINRDLLH